MPTEQELTDAFERAAGGVEKAFRLMRIWQDTANPISSGLPYNNIEKAKVRMNNFRRRAQNEGYSEAAIKAFLRLQ